MKKQERKITAIGQAHFLKLALMALLVVFATVNCNRTGIPGSSAAPEVLFTNPSNNAEEVALDAMLTATFSEEMDTTTFNTTSFNLHLNSSPVPGIITVSATTATFIPLDNLLPGRTYVATVTSDVADIMGFKMTENHTWRFSTIDTTDTNEINIEVTSTSPPDDSEDISLSPEITVNFNEPMNASTLNEESFILRQGTNSIPGSVTVTGDSSATFTPSQNLSYGNTYTATITTGVESVNERTLAANYSWSFTTIENPDNDPPEVTSVEPEENADDVDINTTVSVTFDEEINQSTLNTETFTLRQGNNSVEGSIEYSGTTATFIPDENLEFGESYSARISDEVEDLAGNNLSRNFDWRFTTEDDPDDNPPDIIDADPNDGEDDVSVDVIIAVTFSEAMNPETINRSTFFVREDGPGNSTRSVDGTVTYSGFTAIFTPSEPLNADEDYFAVVTAEVEDEAGNEMDEDFEWKFKTEKDDDDDDDDDD